MSNVYSKPGIGIGPVSGPTSSKPNLPAVLGRPEQMIGAVLTALLCGFILAALLKGCAG